MHKMNMAAKAGIVMLASGVTSASAMENFGAVINIPANDTGIGRDAHGHLVSEEGHVDILYRFVEHDEHEEETAAPADDHDDHDHDDHDDHADETPAVVDDHDDHHGHDHDRRRLSEDDHDHDDHVDHAVNFTQMHEDAKAYYTTNHASGCAAATDHDAPVEVGESFACVKLTLDADLYATTQAIHFPAEHAAEEKMFQYVAFFEGHHDEEEETSTAAAEDDHSGHDHGRMLSEDEHDHSDHDDHSDHADHDDHSEEAGPHFDDIFTVKSVATGAVVKPASMMVNGVVVAADAHDDHDDHAEEETGVDSWTLPILASLIVNLVTFSGVLFMIPFVKKFMTASDKPDAATYAEEGQEAPLPVEGQESGEGAVVVSAAAAQGALDFDMPENMIMYTSAFSAGAILAAAFLLMLPEAQHLLERTIPEADVFWKYGTCALAGFIAPFVFTYAVAAAVPTTEEYSRPFRTLCAVLLGDGFHNFADGVFIGAAFRTCSKSFGWTVAVSSIAHEIGQEVADFFVLTGICKLKPAKALALNFLSGTTVLLGAIIVCATPVSDEALGYILAVGGGTYVQIGASECTPRAFDKANDWPTRLKALGLFIVGAIVIGLVLLDHEHCETGDHAGHDH